MLSSPISYISIHALLAESDPARLKTRLPWTNFYPRSPCGERLLPIVLCWYIFTISIHALLAESDGEVKLDFIAILISIHALLAESDIYPACSIPVARYFYPRSPCGERLECPGFFILIEQFLSTLSLRRATPRFSSVITTVNISIHALLAESDRDQAEMPHAGGQFLSTLSLRRATKRRWPR